MKKKTIKVNLKDRSYSIIIQNSILSELNNEIKSLTIGKKILIVTQDTIPEKYLKIILHSLKKEKYKVFQIVLPHGESHKDLKSLLKIIQVGIKNKFERNDTFISLGGGVTSDLTGFAASIYFRGLNFISIPTTLLGMVDAAIGGKTAVNIKEGKNLLGTFYQPKLVLIDPNTLKTLPKKEFINGMAEVIKYSLLEGSSGVKFKNHSFFSYLQNYKEEILNLNSNYLETIIYFSCLVKANIVSKDEKESNLRAILNLGHTFAHGIEQAYDYKKYTHGEAVSIGICLAAKLAVNEKLLNETDYENIINLVDNYSLPIKLINKNKINNVFSSMLLDKKVKDGKIKLILPYKKIGTVKIFSNINKNKIKYILSQ